MAVVNHGDTYLVAFGVDLDVVRIWQFVLRVGIELHVLIEKLEGGNAVVTTGVT